MVADEWCLHACMYVVDTVVWDFPWGSHGVETAAAFNFPQHSHNISLIYDVLRGVALAIEAIGDVPRPNSGDTG